MSRVVDAEAPGLDLAPLGELLADRAVLKVFHAARQDVEIFLERFGAVPAPLFDTQVAAMVAGFGDQVGYDALVQALTGGTIDKAHRFSDWSARPLSASQIAYAAADVTHLRGVYEKLRARLERDGRVEWVAEEMAVLDDPVTYRADPETLWERLRPKTSNRRMLGLLRAIAAWREREAQRVNIPRQRLLKDESLLEIAATAPTTAEALARVRGITRGFAEGRSGGGLLEALATAAALPESALPPVPRTKEGGKPSPALIALLKVLLAAEVRGPSRGAEAAGLVGGAGPVGDRGGSGRAGAARVAAGGVRGGRPGAEGRADHAGGGRQADQAGAGVRRGGFGPAGRGLAARGPAGRGPGSRSWRRLPQPPRRRRRSRARWPSPSVRSTN